MFYFQQRQRLQWSRVLHSARSVHVRGSVYWRGVWRLRGPSLGWRVSAVSWLRQRKLQSNYRWLVQEQSDYSCVSFFAKWSSLNRLSSNVESLMFSHIPMWLKTILPNCSMHELAHKWYFIQGWYLWCFLDQHVWLFLLSVFISHCISNFTSLGLCECDGNWSGDLCDVCRKRIYGHNCEPDKGTSTCTYKIMGHFCSTVDCQVYLTYNSGVSVGL